MTEEKRRKTWELIHDHIEPQPHLTSDNALECMAWELKAHKMYLATLTHDDDDYNEQVIFVMQFEEDYQEQLAFEQDMHIMEIETDRLNRETELINQHTNDTNTNTVWMIVIAVISALIFLITMINNNPI